MGSFNLKPLSKESIQELGLSPNDLWILKIDDTIHGPFETENLKTYARDNQSQFNHIQATKLNQNFWKPFFSYAVFERREPQSEDDEELHDQGPYWLLEDGIKVGPLSKEDVLKKLEDKIILTTDLISKDEGVNWQKVYQIECFDRRKKGQLPFAPLDESFLQAKLELAEKLEMESSGEVLAEMAHLGQQKAKVLSIKVDEFSINSAPHVSPAMKWAIPAAAAAVIAFIVGGNLLFNKVDRYDVANDQSLTKKDEREVYRPESNQPQRRAPMADSMPAVELAPRQEMPVRRPANIPSIHERPPRSGLTRNEFSDDSAFPTQIETHRVNDRAPSNDNFDQNRDRETDQPEMDRDRDRDSDRERDQYADRDRAVEVEAFITPKEHSIVGKLPGETLDGAMGGKNPDQDPGFDRPVEEISDF
jgi:hypothetical protein